MGLAKSLRKANYLAGLSKGLSDISDMLEAKRKQKEAEEYYEKALNAYNNYKSNQDKVKTGYNILGEINNPFSPENKRGIEGDIVLPNEPIIPEIQTSPMTQSEQYQRGNENLDELLSALAPLVLNPEVGKDQLSRIGAIESLAQNEVGKMKPQEPKLQSFNPKYDLYENGELVKEGEADKELDKLMAKYVGDDDKLRAILQTPGGKLHEETFGKVRDTRSTSNINLPKEGKWEKFGDLVTDVLNPFALEEGEDGTVHTVPLTPNEIKNRKDRLHYGAVSNMIPSAIQWYNQKVKDEWGRENLSEADYYAEIEDGIKNGELTDPETVRDLLDFGAFRRYIFDIDKKSAKAKND